MKLAKSIFIITLCSFMLFSCKTEKKDTNKETSSLSQQKQLVEVAKQAYIYGYAPVYMERQRRNFVSVDKDLGNGRAPTNTISWVRNLATPALKVVVMPNSDTNYGSIWLDLSEYPMLLEVPEFGDRYFCFQFMDAFSNTFDYIGTRQTGQRGGKFALVGPNWKGDLPQGLAGTIKCPTNSVWIPIRFAVNGQSDLETVHKLQDMVKLTKLEGGAVTPKNAGFIPLAPPERWSAEVFYTILGDVLKRYPTPKAAQSLVKSFEKIDLSYKGFDFSSASEEVKEALKKGAKEGFAAIEAAELGSTVNGWEFSMKNGRFGEDYLLRSAIAYRSLAGNVPEEAIYFNANKDFGGELLNGENNYELRFEKGQLPPVETFWSLTMYDGKNFFLIENPIDRYAIGDRTKSFKAARDGSHTIYIQHENPGKEKEGNWLPAPTGIFDVHLRTYIPKKSLLDGSYKLPPLKRVDR